MAARYSVTWIHLNLFNQVHIVGQLGCSHSFAVLNSTALSSLPIDFCCKNALCLMGGKVVPDFIRIPCLFVVRAGLNEVVR